MEINTRMVQGKPRLFESMRDEEHIEIVCSVRKEECLNYNEWLKMKQNQMDVR